MPESNACPRSEHAARRSDAPDALDAPGHVTADHGRVTNARTAAPGAV